MLPLYQGIRPHLQLYNQIYIPLCLYFIRTERKLLCILPDLHSTMLLLYLVMGAQILQKQRYLHSTMLLLYRYGKAFYRLSQVYLHSTMLLLYPADRIDPA